jgi:hypothetical protein
MTDAVDKPKRKSKGPTASARCVEECRKRGWFAVDVIERVVPHTFIRKDWCGFGDILVVDGKPGSLIIQATTAGARSAHVRKILDDCAPAVEAWLAADNRLQIWTWEKRRQPGTKLERWTLGITHITREARHGEEGERQRDGHGGSAEAQREQEAARDQGSRAAG